MSDNSFKNRAALRFKETRLTLRALVRNDSRRFLGLAAISSLTWVILAGVVLAGSNGGIVGEDPIPLSSIFGIINDCSGDDEPTNMELELERLLGANCGETAD